MPLNHRVLSSKAFLAGVTLSLSVLLSIGNNAAFAESWLDKLDNGLAKFESKLDTTLFSKKPIHSQTTLTPGHRVRFGSLESFEVQTDPISGFQTDHRETPPPEISEYIRTALINEKQIKYDSPGEGVLRLVCENERCNMIRAEVIAGVNGPVVWQVSERYRPGVLRFLPDAQAFANQVVAQLVSDYSQAIQPVHMRIEIPEE
jgi:hypothetical protein